MSEEFKVTSKAEEDRPGYPPGTLTVSLDDGELILTLERTDDDGAKSCSVRFDSESSRKIYDYLRVILGRA